jgi:serine/threonine protein kinase
MPGLESNLRVGDLVGCYRLESELGRGRMAVVYRASIPGGEAVALKVITSRLAKDRVFLRRFDREIRVARRVSHPNVVPVLDHGEHGHVPFLVQRLIAGGSLGEFLTRQGPLEITETLRIAGQVASGIDALHAAGLVHRDVTPGNLLLEEDGTACISDFGLVKDTAATRLTRPGQALGSVDFMAPEQIRGGEVSAAADVYSLGCVLHECLLGSPPFGGRPSMRVLFAHMHEEPPDVTGRARGVSSRVARAINRALEKNPEDRPDSATRYVEGIISAAEALV